MLSCTLTILFEVPFWIGLVERSCGGQEQQEKKEAKHRGR